MAKSTGRVWPSTPQEIAAAKRSDARRQMTPGAVMLAEIRQDAERRQRVIDAIRESQREFRDIARETRAFDRIMVDGFKVN